MVRLLSANGIIFLDPFSSAGNLVYCPDYELFSVGLKEGRKGALTPAAFPQSRLEYQLRTTTINVRTVRRGFLDEARRACYFICSLFSYRELILMVEVTLRVPIHAQNC